MSPGGSSPGHSSAWPPPLLRIASKSFFIPTSTNTTPLTVLSASPHDAHLLATFSQDSNLIRILDVRQPGQALVELRGHSASVNCIEWSPSRRGTLASGGDDCCVLVWDLLNQHNAAQIPQQQQPQPTTTLPTPAPAAPGAAGAAAAAAPSTTERGPAAAWQCDYEVSNISWSPQGSSQNSRDWLGVCGGKGFWGVAM